jgi:hypothetical protein
VAYVRQANMMRSGGAEQEQDVESEGNGQEVVLSPERYAELSAH